MKKVRFLFITMDISLIYNEIQNLIIEFYYRILLQNLTQK
jgi:hypothetical protein